MSCRDLSGHSRLNIYCGVRFRAGQTGAAMFDAEPLEQPFETALVVNVGVFGHFYCVLKLVCQHRNQPIRGAVKIDGDTQVSKAASDDDLVREIAAKLLSARLF